MFAQTILIGRLGAKPEIKYLEGNSTAVAKFSMVTNRKYKGKQGFVEEATWHNITIWGKQAEACAQYLAKGALVQVIGRPCVDKVEGTNGVKYFNYVTADRCNFMPGNKNAGNSGGGGFAGGGQKDDGFGAPSGGGAGGAFGAPPSGNPEDIPF